MFERDELVACAEIYRGRGEGDVRPSHRGRGIGAALLGWIEGRARELASTQVGQAKTDANTAARELFLANGYEPSWTSWMIRIGLDEPPPPPEAPPGIAIRAYRASDAREVHRVIDAAFTEWEGRDPEPYEVWAPQIIAHPAFRPELSPLALDGDEIVGVVISYDFPELGEGWIQQLATRATHRRRGIARALLRTSFGWFYEAGRRVAGVATDSRTGALGLYEKVGMHVERQYTRYASTSTPERWPRDSNPRGGCPPTRSPGVPLRPLGQATAVESSGGVTPNGRPSEAAGWSRGGDRIRTCEGRIRPLTAFEAVPFVRSGTPPGRV